MNEAEFMVAAYPRLHFGLIDLAGATARAYGGAGAAIDGLAATVSVTGVSRQRLEVDLDGADHEVREKVGSAFNRAMRQGLELHGTYYLQSRLPGHVGLGSTTATTMAFLYAAAVANAWKVTSDDLITLSGRGRTSAVGCNSFFEGGLIIDAGQPSHPKGSYLPSLQPAHRAPSLRVGHWPMPASWQVMLMFLDQPPSVAPDVEAAFFSTQTPTPREETLGQLAALYHDLLPAVIERDLQSFGRALRSFQDAGFKAREIDAQPAMVQGILRFLWRQGFAAGLSSLGPTVFVIIEDDGSAQTLRDIGRKRGVTIQGPYLFRNDNRSVNIETASRLNVSGA